MIGNSFFNFSAPLLTKVRIVFLCGDANPTYGAFGYISDKQKKECSVFASSVTEGGKIDTGEGTPENERVKSLS